MRSALLSSSLLGFTMFGAAPGDQGAGVPPSVEPAVARYSTDITVYDQARRSSVVLRVSSDDSEAVRGYSSGDFVLSTVRPGESVGAALQRSGVESVRTPSRAGEFDSGSGPEPGGNGRETHFQVVGRSLAAGVDSYAVTVRARACAAMPDSWDYAYFSGATNDNYGAVCRHSFWHGVYFGCEYKKYDSSSWSTIKAEWEKLGNNETWYAQREVCSKMRIHVAYKQRDDFTVWFKKVIFADPK